MQDFNVGVVVLLKSGSPKMTVISLSDDKAFCHWFDENDNLKGNTFPLACLKVVSIGTAG